MVRRPATTPKHLGNIGRPNDDHLQRVPGPPDVLRVIAPLRSVKFLGCPQNKRHCRAISNWKVLSTIGCIARDLSPMRGMPHEANSAGHSDEPALGTGRKSAKSRSRSRFTSSRRAAINCLGGIPGMGAGEDHRQTVYELHGEPLLPSSDPSPFIPRGVPSRA